MKLLSNFVFVDNHQQPTVSSVINSCIYRYIYSSIQKEQIKFPPVSLLSSATFAVTEDVKEEKIGPDRVLRQKMA